VRQRSGIAHVASDEALRALELKPVTARELARKLGVSQSTISRAYSQHASISPAMRMRVLEAAEALGYQPNFIARSLTTRRSNIVGIVMATMTNPFYPEILEQLAKALQLIGLQTLLFHVPPGQEVDSELPLLLQYQVDAVVIASATISSAMARVWTATGRPAVLINRTVPAAGVTSVSCDNVAGAREIADYLVARGHRRLAYVSGKPNTSTNVDREHGFRGRLRELGIDLFAHVPGHEYSYAAGYDAAAELARLRPDAVFFANDIMAVGGMDAFRHDFGLCVPEDIEIVGFDDIPMAGWPSYRLTTVQQPLARMVQTTVQFLMESLDQPAVAPTTHLIAGTLIERASTKGAGDR
jgi:DNA-binding LacI/PurR family transcriptional regulator